MKFTAYIQIILASAYVHGLPIEQLAPSANSDLENGSPSSAPGSSIPLIAPDSFSNEDASTTSKDIKFLTVRPRQNGEVSASSENVPSYNGESHDLEGKDDIPEPLHESREVKRYNGKSGGSQLSHSSKSPGVGHKIKRQWHGKDDIPEPLHESREVKRYNGKSGGSQLSHSSKSPGVGHKLKRQWPGNIFQRGFGQSHSSSGFGSKLPSGSSGGVGHPGHPKLKRQAHGGVSQGGSGQSHSSPGLGHKL